MVGVTTVVVEVAAVAVVVLLATATVIGQVSMPAQCLVQCATPTF
jgi:hypothetical protein